MSFKRNALALTTVVALGLAGTAALPPFSPSAQERAVMTSLMSTPKFLTLPEGRIAYDDAGEGPLVILVPGLGDLRAEYRSLAPRLVASGHRVITMDLRGHGQSSTGWSDYSSAAIGRDVIAMIDHLGAGKATLVGTSMGAGAVAWAAAEAPAKIERISLIGPFVREIPPASVAKNLMMKAMIKAALAGPWGPSAWGATYGTFYGTKPADFDTYRTALVANLKEPGRMAALKGMINASKTDVEARLADVTVPVQVIMGTKDPDFADPKVEAETVATLLRGTVHMIEGAGHYPQVENPAKVHDVIAGFIGKSGV